MTSPSSAQDKCHLCFGWQGPLDWTDPQKKPISTVQVTAIRISGLVDAPDYFFFSPQKDIHANNKSAFIYKVQKKSDKTKTLLFNANLSIQLKFTIVTEMDTKTHKSSFLMSINPAWLLDPLTSRKIIFSIDTACGRIVAACTPYDDKKHDASSQFTQCLDRLFQTIGRHNPHIPRRSVDTWTLEDVETVFSNQLPDFNPKIFKHEEISEETKDDWRKNYLAQTQEELEQRIRDFIFELFCCSLNQKALWTKKKGIDPKQMQQSIHEFFNRTNPIRYQILLIAQILILQHKVAKFQRLISLNLNKPPGDMIFLNSCTDLYPDDKEIQDLYLRIRIAHEQEMKEIDDLVAGMS